MTALAAWQNFYVIVGSSAGALIGLQFVVMSLITTGRTTLPDPEAGQAFATPTIVHFAAVLGLSAIVSAPWDRMEPVAIIWAVGGVAGLIYSALVVRRMRAQSAYRPVFEDWLFHVLLPLTAYLALLASAAVAPFFFNESLFGPAAAALVLLFVGIHNAWDAVTYHVFVKARKKEQESRG